MGAALADFSGQFRDKVDIRLDLGVDDGQIPRSFGVPIFKIIQEAVANALHHGNADMVNVQMKQSKERITLSIRDNGKGFRTAAVSMGNGLINMRERANAIQGDLSIRSRQGKGCHVIVCFSCGEARLQTDSGRLIRRLPHMIIS